MTESTARSPTADVIFDRLVAHEASDADADAVCLGLKDLAAEPGSAAKLAAIADDLRQRTALHLLPLAVQKILQPDPVYQTAALIEGRIHTVAEVRLVGVGTEELFEAIFSTPWTWWRRGHISGWTHKDDGGLRFVLWPAWLRSPARVGIELSPPAHTTETTPSGATWTRISSAASFFADFDGPGRYEILSEDEVSVFRSVWDGVQRRGFLRLMPAAMVLDVHVRAEAGTLTFPFPPGTGFPGLIHYLGASGTPS